MMSETQSSMPMPPMSYINQFTDENVKRGRVPNPPAPPAQHEVYRMFGVNFHSDDAIIRCLESQGLRRLYAQNFDHRRELKKLNLSILVNFLDLLEIIIICPDSSKRQEKIEDISLLFINMHHLINEFRPHQARETLRVMMELQKRQTLQTCDKFQKDLEKSLEIIREALDSVPEYYEEESRSKSDSSGKRRRNIKRLSADHKMCKIIDSL